eukprot:4933637-Alexandrium_andersonii.AAC.1
MLISMITKSLLRLGVERGVCQTRVAPPHDGKRDVRVHLQVVCRESQPLGCKRRFGLSMSSFWSQSSGLSGPTGRSTGPGCWGRLATQQG